MLRSNFNEILQRNIDFTLDDKRRGALLHIEYIDAVKIVDVKPLEQWNFPLEYQQYLDACIERDMAVWRQRDQIDDDTIPYIKPYYGIAEHSAFVGGTVCYGGNTSYHEHPITDWSKLDTLVLDENNDNFKMLMNSLRYLKSREAEVGFVAALRGGEAPMDMANALRGNELFMDFYDEEENVHKLLRFCLKASQWTFSHQSEIIGQIQGGVMSGIGIWLPGNAIGHLAEDASSMCSAPLYREFGQPYTQKLLQDYDCAIMHTHTMGRHVLADIAAIEKVEFIQLTYDPNQITPIDTYKEYENILNNKIVVLTMTLPQLQQNLGFLANHKSIINMNVADLEQANQAVALIKSIR